MIFQYKHNIGIHCQEISTLFVHTLQQEKKVHQGQQNAKSPVSKSCIIFFLYLLKMYVYCLHHLLKICIVHGDVDCP